MSLDLSDLGSPRVIGKNLLAILYHQLDIIDFLHVPSAMSRKPPERWSIPGFSFKALDYTAWSPENVLFVAEKKEE